MNLKNILQIERTNPRIFLRKILLRRNFCYLKENAERSEDYFFFAKIYKSIKETKIMKKTLLTLTIAGMSLFNSSCNKHKNYNVLEKDGDLIFYNLTELKKNKYEIIEYRNYEYLNKKFPGLDAKTIIYYDYLDELGYEKIPEFKINGDEYTNPNELLYRHYKERLEKIKKELK